MNAPTMVSFSGATAKIERIHKQKPAGKETDHWIGRRYEITADYLGLYLKTDLEYEYRHIDGTDLLLSRDLKALKFDATTKIQRHYKDPTPQNTTQLNFKLKPGMTAILKVDSLANTKGTTDYIVIIPLLIDETGQTVN